MPRVVQIVKEIGFPTQRPSRTKYDYLYERVSRLTREWFADLYLPPVIVSSFRLGWSSSQTGDSGGAYRSKGIKRSMEWPQVMVIYILPLAKLINNLNELRI